MYLSSFQRIKKNSRWLAPNLTIESVKILLSTRRTSLRRIILFISASLNFRAGAKSRLLFIYSLLLFLTRRGETKERTHLLSLSLTLPFSSHSVERKREREKEREIPQRDKRRACFPIRNGWSRGRSAWEVTWAGGTYCGGWATQRACDRDRQRDNPFSPPFRRALVPRKRQGRVKEGRANRRGNEEKRVGSSVDRTRRDTVGGKGERVIGLDRSVGEGRDTVERARDRGRWKMVEAPQKKEKKNVVRDASQKRQRGEKERGRELFPWNLRRRGYTVRSERDKEGDRRNDIRYLEGTTREKKTVHASLSEEERCICGTRKDRGTRTVLRATSGGTKEGERESASEKESDNPCAERRKMERGEDRLTERGGRIYTTEQESPLLREGRAVIRRGRLFDRDWKSAWNIRNIKTENIKSVIERRIEDTLSR